MSSPGRRLIILSARMFLQDQTARSPDAPVLQRSVPHPQAERPGPLHSQGERRTEARLRFIQHF